MLQIENLTKSYGDLVAVDGVNLRVEPGKIVGFVGPNGAGKSTTMRSIFGLVAPDAGVIRWSGEEVTQEHMLRFGYMPEQRGLYPKMKIAEQVAFFGELKGVPAKRARAQAEELLGALDLGDRLEDPLEKLSHGNQQRVQLAVSLVNNPDLLVLDEPFNGLDPVAVITLQEVLAEQVSNGAGVLFSSHQLDLVERVCDEIVVIVAGKVLARGSVRDVRAAGGERRVTVEVDKPIMPIIDALDPETVVSSTTESATVRVSNDAELEEVLARARQAGSVVRFDYDLPSLEERFASIVYASSDAGEQETGEQDMNEQGVAI